MQVLAAHSMAQTAFTVKARDGKARSGLLMTKTGSIETPAVLLYTRRGGPLSLTSPDMLAAVTPPVSGVQVSAMQFLEHPDASILRDYGQGAHMFLCLEGYPILASNRDPTMYEYGARPCTDREVHVTIHSGGHMVSPERYMENMAALKPDLYVTLCDEVPADAKPKRVAASVKRTTAWLDTCLQLHGRYQQPELRGKKEVQHEAAQLAQHQHGAHNNRAPDQPQPQPQPQLQSRAPGGFHNGLGPGPAVAAAGAAGAAEADGAGGGAAGRGSGEGPLSGALVLAALGGGALLAERARAAEAVADKNGVAGYALCGLGTGEDPELRAALIAASLGALPPSAVNARPVFASGLVASPEELLEAVAAGLDLLDCAFVSQVTAGGYALTFPLRPPSGWQPLPKGDEGGAAAAADRSAELAAAGPGVGPDVSIGADETKINLWSTSYRLDKGPLLPGCDCFACRRHSRAYLHHLLNTHEMLADVLLEAHNTSHMQGFCQAIREAISAGQFDTFRAWFRRLRAAPLVPAPQRIRAKRRASDSAIPAEDGVTGGERLDAGAEGMAGPGAEAEAEASGLGGPRQDAGPAKWVRV